MVSEQELLKHFEELPHRRASFKQLLRELHVKGAARQELKLLLNELVRRRRLLASRHHFELPAPVSTSREPARVRAHEGEARPEKGELVGRISVHRDGFGFVLPATAKAQERTQEIFIPPPFTGQAMHGDTVAVKVLRSTDGRSEGKVVRVLHRAHAAIVGTFHYGRTHNYVRPLDERLREVVIIPRGAEWPAAMGSPTTSRAGVHRVLGREAHHVPTEDPTFDLQDAIVEVEITQYATASAEPRGRVVEILGHEGDFGIDVEIIIRKHHLPHRFAPEVLKEAEAITPTIPLTELERRRDFRHLPIVTIDGETARDFDDAVYVMRRGNGNYELQVHIADVAHYVQAGSAIDSEARLRGTSVYFPDRAVPMLPVQLSTDICSLRPQQDRLVMSCLMEISPAGDIVNYEITPGVIYSAARMTYTDVNAAVSGNAAMRTRYATLVPLFERMLELEEILYRRRLRQGAIDFDLPEPTIEFDESGMMQSIVKAERNVAHRIIEEFMLAANETVARYLQDVGIASVYRIHEKPSARKIAEFEEVAAAFGYSLGVGALPIRRLRQRVGGKVRTLELPVEADVPITPRHYQKLAEALAGKPEERILSYLMLRSLPQARYSAENSGHFALAKTTYTHFTSPIRRYPDLLVHRLLKAVLQRGPGTPAFAAARPLAGSEDASPASDRVTKIPARSKRRRQSFANSETDATLELRSASTAAALLSFDEIQLLARESSEAERRADEAERELLDWKKVRFMEQRLGEEFAALILHVTKNGFFVELTDLFIEGFVPISSLEDDRYLFREGGHELVGENTRRRYRIGDRLRVLVERIDPVRHKINFTPAAPHAPLHERRRRKGLPL